MALRIPLPDYFSLDTGTAAGATTGILRVRDLRTDRLLAVKAYRPPAWMTAREANAQRDRVAAALEPLTRLACTGMAPVREVFDRDGVVCLARDYVPGTPLSAKLRDRGALTLEDVHAVTARVAATVDRLAQAGVVHGALTPDNVIFANDGSIVVTDAAYEPAIRSFRLANSRCSFRRRGTPAEDIRALATLAYRALTGTAGSGRDRAAAFGLPWAAREALRRAMAGDRRAFGSSTELAEALWPAERPAIFRMVWKPAAAMGVLSALATIGGTATSDSVRHSQPASVERTLDHQLAIGPAAAPADIPAEAPAPAQTAPVLSADDMAALRSAMSRHGVALLANPAAAEVFRLSDGQRQLIDLRLTEERLRVGRVVNAAADGKLFDTATPMSQIREDTRASILRILTPDQRALWDTLDQSASAGQPAL
jgi:hypothetical protein